jgi:hypothetical protein
VAVTDPPVVPGRRRARRPLRDLPWIAAGIGTLAAREAQGQSSVNAQFLLYKESGGRTQVLNPVILWNQDFGKAGGELSLTLGYDSISGASPTGAYPTSDVTTSASGTVTASGNIPQAVYKDTRESVGLTYGRRFGANLPTVNLAYAHENDYTARSIGFSDAWTLLGGRATLHFGAAFSRDTVSPVSGPDVGQNLPKNTNGFSLGWTWILGERDLADISVSLMNLSGYLNDPYKVVPIRPDTSNETAPDSRPDTRSRRTIVAKYSHYFLWGGSINAFYRYYGDDWSVHANTLDVTYNQKLDADWIVSPEIRLYTQTGAYFFGNRFLVAQPYMSSDYRLSPFGSFMGGLTLSRRLYDSITANVGVTFLSQHGRDRITLVPTTEETRGSNSVSAADMTVTTITFGLLWVY